MKFRNTKQTDVLLGVMNEANCNRSLVKDAELRLAMLQKHKVKLKFVRAATIPYRANSSDYVGGYFTTEFGKNPTFGVAVTSDIESWYPTFVHEYCHFLQWLEDEEQFNELDYKLPCGEFGDVYDLLSQWSRGETALTRKQLVQYCDLAFKIEFDCERRTCDELERIMSHLPWEFSRDEYTRKGIAYALEYKVIPQLGENRDVAPYECPALYGLLPTTFEDFDADYWACYLMHEYRQYCYSNAMDEEGDDE